MKSSPQPGSAPPPSPAPSSSEQGPTDTRDARAARRGTGGYEQLSGGSGREVFFRPERYGADDLGPINPVVALSTPGGDDVEFRLHDVSQNGVAFIWSADEPAPDVGTTLDPVRVLFDEHEAYRGMARVRSVRSLEEGTLVGASLVDDLVDIDDVLRLRDVRAWDRSRTPKFGPQGKAWHVEGHQGFKSGVSELRLFFEDAREEIRTLEESLPWHVVYGDTDSAARTGLLSLLRERFVAPVLEYNAEIDAELRRAADADWQALREFSIRNVHDFLMAAPVMHRALHKPFGYPGDYQVMRYMYELPFEGPTLFARAMQLAMVSTPAATAVRTRKDVIKTELRGLIEQAAPGTSPTRIASVAAGPAQEVFELLSEMETCPTDVEIVLFDQDKGALSLAYTRLRRLVEQRHPGRVRITYLYDSIRRLLRDPELFQSLGPFDAIICAGLYDYLQLRTAVHLTAKYHSHLTEGGCIYLGNMTPTNATRWLMEHHLDWNLVYRSPAEFVDMGRVAVPDASVDLLEEPTGVNPILRIRRG